MKEENLGTWVKWIVVFQKAKDKHKGNQEVKTAEKRDLVFSPPVMFYEIKLSGTKADSRKII